MTHHLHIDCEALGFSFFLDVPDLATLKTTLLTLNDLPTIPARVDTNVITATPTSAQTLLADYHHHYMKRLEHQNVGAPIQDTDILSITLLEDEDDPDCLTLPLSPTLQVTYTLSAITCYPEHPLLTLPTSQSLVATVNSARLAPHATGSKVHSYPTEVLYGALAQVLSTQAQVNWFSATPTSVIISLKPFSTIDQALKAHQMLVT